MLRTARYTPRYRAELVACLFGLGDCRMVSLSPDAAKLLQRYPVHTVKDVLDSPAWPCGRRGSLWAGNTTLGALGPVPARTRLSARSKRQKLPSCDGSVAHGRRACLAQSAMAVKHGSV
jgi:hypothetical protein